MEQELVLTPPPILANREPDSLLDIIERAVMSPEFDVAKLQSLLELKERHDRNEARKAFVQAMSAFKAHAIKIVRDKTNKQYDSKYVSLGKLVATVTPYLSQHGLSIRWDQDQSNGIKVSCIVTHIAGHFETVSMTVPPDTSGAKNPIQQIKSAITYAKACTFESICGLASTDGNVDDDGNGAGATNADLTEAIEWIENSRNVEELKAMYTQAIKKFDSNKNAKAQIIAAKDKRKSEL
jgi:hypothetical protein